MKLDPVSILQEVIDRDGDCEGLAGPAVCSRCPLGTKTVNGRRVNCMDYLKLVPGELTREEQSDIYKKAAEDELFTIEMESHLMGESED